MIVHGDPNRIHWGKDIVCDRDHLFFVVRCGDVWIEDEVVLGYEVRFLCGSHNYKLKGKYRRPPYAPTEPFDIRICTGAWVASFVTICAPCVIGPNSVVGAGSVVTKDVPAGELWCGNPAQFVKVINFIDDEPV